MKPDKNKNISRKEAKRNTNQKKLEEFKDRKLSNMIKSQMRPYF